MNAELKAKADRYANDVLPYLAMDELLTQLEHSAVRNAANPGGDEYVALGLIRNEITSRSTPAGIEGKTR